MCASHAKQKKLRECIEEDERKIRGLEVEIGRLVERVREDRRKIREVERVVGEREEAYGRRWGRGVGGEAGRGDRGRGVRLWSWDD